MRDQLVKIYRRLALSVVESLEYAKPKIFAFGVLGIVGFLLYYLVWGYVFPQPYENLPLRLACIAVALPTLFIEQWPARLRPYLPVYWYAALTLCVPAFFTFMALHNGYNPAWSGATGVAIVLMILVMDAANAFVMVAIGSTLAFGSFVLFSGKPIPWSGFLVQLAVQFFGLAAGAVFDVANERERRAKLVSAMAFGGQIAHELGTPLQSIRLGARAAVDLLPAMNQTYDMAIKAGLKVPLHKADLHFLETTASRIDKEVDYALLFIDMMLTKAGRMDSSEEQFTRFDTMRCVQSAFERYTFKSEVEKRWVKIDAGVDFRVRAVELMFVHVLFNLLKNSLYALRAAHRRGAGEIRVWAQRGESFNRLYFRDNGVGIPEHVIGRIFDPFYTTQSRGTGLGLHFCRGVIRRFGGDITCRSELGVFTEFTLTFPVDEDEQQHDGLSSSRLQACDVREPSADGAGRRGRKRTLGGVRRRRAG